MNSRSIMWKLLLYIQLWHNSTCLYGRILIILAWNSWVWSSPCIICCIISRCMNFFLNLSWHFVEYLLTFSYLHSTCLNINFLYYSVHYRHSMQQLMPLSLLFVMGVYLLLWGISQCIEGTVFLMMKMGWTMWNVGRPYATVMYEENCVICL